MFIVREVNGYSVLGDYVIARVVVVCTRITINVCARVLYFILNEMLLCVFYKTMQTVYIECGYHTLRGVVDCMWSVLFKTLFCK